MFGRPREHHWLGSDRNARVVTIAVFVLGGLFVLLVVSALVAVVR